jgi:hypothetical protein
MSLKCSESSERARQTGSTALKGTSRNAPKAIKRLSHVSDDGAFLDVPFCRELPGVLEVCGSGRPPWAQQPQPDPGRALPAPERQRLSVPESLLCPHSSGTIGPVYRHRPGPRSPEHRLVPAYRIRYCYSMSSDDHTAEELFFLRVFLGLGAEAGAGRDVGRWPNGRAGVARDRGCAAGRSGRWASPIRSAIGW